MVGATLGLNVTLVSLADGVDIERVGHILRPYNIDSRYESSAATVTFGYATPLSVPSIIPRPDSIERQPLQADGGDALVYGMVDALPLVTAKRVVYDPQSAWLPLRFRSQLGGTAEKLAYVLNARELRRLVPDLAMGEAARSLMRDENAQIVVVKNGLSGAVVFEGEVEHRVPAYRRGQGANLVGSGDVFSAAFACRWFAGDAAADAARAASRMVANFVADGIVEAVDDPLPEDVIKPWSGDVYIAGPFFTLAERWLVEEVRLYVEELGMRARSPLHEVGIGRAEVIAPADLAMLGECQRVLALCDGRDPGTIFEAGYATKTGIPVWAVSTSTREADADKGDLRMLLGTGSRIFDDLTAALVDLATAE